MFMPGHAHMTRLEVNIFRSVHRVAETIAHF